MPTVKPKRAYRITNRSARKWGKRRVYPWDKWLNGEPWVLEFGKDFRCSVKAFGDAVWVTAARRNVRATVRRLGGGAVEVQAYEG